MLARFHQSQLTQSDFASQHGIGLSTLSRWLCLEREAVSGFRFLCHLLNGFLGLCAGFPMFCRFTIPFQSLRVIFRNAMPIAITVAQY
jgi:transcriptional regulator with XRE-family HTH domain